MADVPELDDAVAASAALVACAYLPLSSPLEIGPWVLTGLAEFDGPWLGEWYQRRASRLLERHLDAKGEPVNRPSFLVKSETGADGSFPQDHEYLTVQQALNFGVLDANPRWTEDGDNVGWFMFTADNSQLRLWQIPGDTDLVVLRSGSMVELTTMGRGIEDADFGVVAPLELHLPLTTARPDEDVVNALFDVGMQSAEESPEGEMAARILTSIKWLSKAWLNTPSVDWFDRVVFLRTGFEALFGVSRTQDLRPLIRELFEALGATEEGARDLHWSPSEKEDRYHASAKADLTDLEHWFQSFTDTRNEIVHEGAEPDLIYDEKESAYRGPYPQIAQQVLRDAIRAFLAVNFGPKDIWRSSSYRKLAALFGDDEVS